MLAINALAPFTINSRLQPLLLRSPEPMRFIVNVSAMEGKFYRYKTPSHPHTNMAKAALNMMTRTCAEELAKSHRIYMNSVDTGWINDENPLERAREIAERHHFQTPLDEIDAGDHTQGLEARSPPCLVACRTCPLLLAVAALTSQTFDPPCGKPRGYSTPSLTPSAAAARRSTANSSRTICRRAGRWSFSGGAAGRYRYCTGWC